MTSMVANPSQRRELHQLADGYGIEVEYENAMRQKCQASPESLIQILQVLGAPLDSPTGARAAWREFRQARWRRVLEPVNVLWSGEGTPLRVRIPHAHRGTAEWRIRLEDGTERTGRMDLNACPIVDSETIERVKYALVEWAVPSLPTGYHELELEYHGEVHRSHLIVAPRQSYDPQDGEERVWGAFLPLYAIHSARSWGSGDFSDLATFAQWIAAAGGRVVGTLPLLAAFLDQPCERSPYSPASRLFWNEMYLDVERIPEFSASAAARGVVDSPEFRQQLHTLRGSPLVDYPRQMALKRRVLEVLASELAEAPAERQAAFRQFLQQRPAVEDYARFRAAGECFRAPWSQWPQRLRDGAIEADDFAPEAYHYHRYVQWIADEQLAAVAETLRRDEMRLYLDLPLGVNADSYDVWRERSSFALGANGGCPPDIVFPKGQDWGFPPMHPQGIRQQGYRYVIDYLRHQLKYAGVLRIDHIPVFHRLYWIPQGFPATEGVYVRYPAEELYAVFSLESHRHRVLLVGEDLGTVPPEVPRAMQDHRVHGMYVAQYALQPEKAEVLPPAPYTSIASLNTHDMPPFAAFLSGEDIPLRQSLDLLGELDPEKESFSRAQAIEALVDFLRKQLAERDGQFEQLERGDPAAMTQACLQLLASGPARMLLVNLEDLWQEHDPQNMPGTCDSYPNWQRKAKRSWEEFSRDPAVLEVLAAIQEQRVHGGQSGVGVGKQ